METNITPLLESIVTDNENYDFPIDAIRKELFQLLLHQDEFDYFVSQAHRKLKMDYPPVFALVFVNTLHLRLDTDNIDIYNVSPNIYEDIILEFTEQLERLQITRIDRDTPDGEMMSAMC